MAYTTIPVAPRAARATASSAARAATPGPLSNGYPFDRRIYAETTIMQRLAA
ncbi:hypothetical protein GGF42_003923, partial [Coemansia sp. RSA 2424]